jgi:Domain of unknown function (DUF1788)
MISPTPLLNRGPLENAIADLEKDLLAEGGPAISPMRNFRFAILAYPPKDEFMLRQRIHGLSDKLRARDWNVLSISLQALLLNRLRAIGDEWLQSRIDRERRLAARDTGRALQYLIDEVAPKLYGPDGLAGDIATRVAEFAQRGIDPERTVIFVGRAGALYPFHRSSALLKHLDGKTHNLPVVLLYPGVRSDGSALSFMGRVAADRDYRPRIYS